MVKSIYRRQYEALLKDLIEEFKESINKETPTEFTSLEDIFNTNPEAKQIKEYLLECTKEHCPNMNPLFIDIYLAIYYKTNEPIDGNLLRMMFYETIPGNNTKYKKCEVHYDVGRSHYLGHTGICIVNKFDIKGKKDIDYVEIETYLFKTNDEFGLTTPCFNQHLLERKPIEPIYLYAVRPEYIKFMLNNMEVIGFKDHPVFKKYVDYYKYLENCTHPDKLGTVEFIIEPKVDSFDNNQGDGEKLDLILDKLSIIQSEICGHNVLFEKLENLKNDISVTNNRFKYLLDLVNSKNTK